MKGKYKALAVLSILFAIAFMPAQAGIYTYSNNSPKPIMQTYSATWNSYNDVLSLSSTWNNMPGMEIDKISFLISDGGSPWRTVNNGVKTEQFLFYTLDLAANTVLVEEYFGRNDIGTFSGLLDISSNGFSLDFDTNMLGLHAGSFGSLAYNGPGFDDTIGIWHYLYSNGQRKETLDIHYGDTVEVPEPSTMALLGLGLLGMASRRKLTKK